MVNGFAEIFSWTHYLCKKHFIDVLFSINSVNKLNELTRIILLSEMNYIKINITRLNMTTKMIE